MQRQTTGMPYLLKDKQCIQQITRPRLGKKNASRGATPSINCSLSRVLRLGCRSPLRSETMLIDSVVLDVRISTDLFRYDTPT